VVIVGGGLAGLAAARTLAGNGLETLVLEAGAAVGGRVASERIDGWLVDRGFQLLNPTYPALRRYLDVALLRLQPLGVGVVTALPDGSHVTVPDPRQAPLAALAGLSRLTDLREVAALARLVLRVGLTPVRRLESAPDLGWHAALDGAGVDGRLRRTVLEPFMTGTLADGDGTTSRRYVDLVLRSFVTAALSGAPGVPAAGMQALPAAIAAPLAGRIRTGVAVTGVERASGGWSVVTDAGPVHATAVVLAAGPASTLLTAPHGGQAIPAMRGLTTYWHVTDAPATDRRRGRYLHVDGTGGHRHQGGLVNTVVMSRSAPSYRPPDAPDGAELVATTVLGGSPSIDGEGAALSAAGRVLGTSTSGWRLLTVHAIADALPHALPPLAVRSPVALGDGLFAVGDHLDTPSIQGALASGRRGGRAALRHVLRPKGALPEEASRAG
jgi:phytoene dehydrogenase-like protein